MANPRMNLEVVQQLWSDSESDNFVQNLDENIVLEEILMNTEVNKTDHAQSLRDTELPSDVGSGWG